MTESELSRGQQIDQFRVLKQLGRGGMADVYLAEDMLLQRQVVLKVILPHIAAEEGLIARFQREATATARLDHPHIVQIYSIGNLPDGRPYIAMQYIPGGALRDYLQGLIEQGQWITPAYALQLMRQIAEALATAHAAGIVHRDLKPGNILLKDDGTAVLSDLGIAAVQQAGTRLTSTGGILGTPHYMSPEQAAGHTVDGRSDIYALGIILYELLSGHPPFMADSPLVVVHHQLYEQPRPLAQSRPGLSAVTYGVVEKCLQKDANARYQSAMQLVAALDGALQAEGATAVAPTVVEMPAYITTEQLAAPPFQPSPPSLPPAPSSAPPAQKPKSNRLLWGLIPFFLLVILLLSWVAFFRDMSQEPIVTATASSGITVAPVIAEGEVGATIPLSAPTDLQPTIVPATATPLIPTATPLPPTATPQPTSTPRPTNTPRPANLLCPTNATEPDVPYGEFPFGRGMIVVGAYTSMAGAQDNAEALYASQGYDVTYFFRKNQYRAAITGFPSESAAEGCLAKVQEINSQAYTRDLSLWCPNNNDLGDYYECK